MINNGIQVLNVQVEEEKVKTIMTIITSKLTNINLDTLLHKDVKIKERKKENKINTTY